MLIDCDPEERSCGGSEDLSLHRHSPAKNRDGLGLVCRRDHSAGGRATGDDACDRSEFYRRRSGRPTRYSSVKVDLLRKQIHSLSQHFKYIVIDLGSELDAIQLGILDDATVILVVATPEVLVVNQTRRMINELLAVQRAWRISFKWSLNKVSRAGA